MIKFFRHLRLRLLSEGKTSKYFKYAIGEIVLVVLGILIAISINTWIANNQNKKEARFQLTKLRDNLQQDKLQLYRAISQDSTYVSDLIFCVKVLSNEMEASHQDFIDRSQSISNTNTFSPVRATYNGLISTGKIELIHNQDLLEGLFSYYNNTNYTAWDSALKDYTRNIIVPYFLNFDHISNTTTSSQGQHFTKFDISKFAVPSKTIEDYKNNLFVLNGFRTKIKLLEGQKYVYTDLLGVIDTLLNDIENELNN